MLYRHDPRGPFICLYCLFLLSLPAALWSSLGPSCNLARGGCAGPPAWASLRLSQQWRASGRLVPTPAGWQVTRLTVTLPNTDAVQVNLTAGGAVWPLAQGHDNATWTLPAQTTALVPAGTTLRFTAVEDGATRTFTLPAQQLQLEGNL